MPAMGCALQKGPPPHSRPLSFISALTRSHVVGGCALSPSCDLVEAVSSKPPALSSHIPVLAPHTSRPASGSPYALHHVCCPHAPAREGRQPSPAQALVTCPSGSPRGTGLPSKAPQCPGTPTTNRDHQLRPLGRRDPREMSGGAAVLGPSWAFYPEPPEVVAAAPKNPPHQPQHV